MVLKELNIVLYRIVVILLILVILTLSVVSNRFARYATGDRGMNGADVAAFNVGIEYGEVIDNDLTKLYPIRVTNRSEVITAFHKVIVEFKEPLRKNITLTLVDMEGTPLCPEQVSDSEKTQFEFEWGETMDMYDSVDFQLQLTQDYRTIYEEYDYTVRIIISVYQVD